MKKQHISFLATCFLVLLAAAIFVSRPLENDKKHAQSLLPFTRNAVAAFEISEFTQGLSFKKEGDTWLVRRVKTDLAKKIEKDAHHNENGIPANFTEDTEYKLADVVKVTSLLTALGLAEITTPVASEVASLTKFQINDASLRVVFFDKSNQELGRVSIGKIGPELMSTFVRVGHEANVYLVNENLRDLATTRYEEWMVPSAQEN